MAIVHYFPSKSEMAKNVADKFPVQALAYMREHPVPGPIFNAYGFGGYMIFRAIRRSLTAAARCSKKWACSRTTCISLF